MTQKFLYFIASRSEHARKIIAGVILAVAGIMIFFAWTAGVSARLPLLGSDFADATQSAIVSGGISTAQPRANEGTPTATAVSPIKGLIESFRDLMRLFHGDAPAPAAANTAAPDQASSSRSQPLDVLFNKVGDETQSNATTTATAPPPIPPPITTQDTPPHN